MLVRVSFLLIVIRPIQNDSPLPNRETWDHISVLVLMEMMGLKNVVIQKCG